MLQPEHRLFVQVAFAPVHCAAVVHSTQSPLAVSQMGVIPPTPPMPPNPPIPPRPAHPALVVQPAMHACVVPLQMGRAAGQSVLDSHATHVPVAVLQTGALALPAQSALVPHCTHCCVVASQTGPLALPLQSVALRQPTHAPVVVSQRSVVPAHTGPPSTVQDAWHV